MIALLGTIILWAMGAFVAAVAVWFAWLVWVVTRRDK